MIYDDTICTLGEGPLWHPERDELLWFDILEKRLHRKGQHWQFDDYVSAAGWISRDELLIASATALSVFNLGTGASEIVAPLEADNAITRSNDGRADPFGGFWIGTMGIEAQDKAGAIYRYYRGELRQLFPDITISNAICFAPDGSHAHFADTKTGKVYKQRLSDKDGWPIGDPEVWIDFSGTPWNPDGAVMDASGNFWNAQWGGYRVACYGPDAEFLRAMDLPAAQVTCPAFGGPDMATLHCTSAAVGLEDGNPDHGKTFANASGTYGQAEHQVIL